MKGESRYSERNKIREMERIGKPGDQLNDERGIKMEERGREIWNNIKCNGKNSRN